MESLSRQGQRTRREWVCSAGATLAAGVLAGCGTAGGSGGRGANGVVTVPVMQWGDVPTVDMTKKIIAAFEAKHPKIRVSLQIVTSNFSAKLETLLAGNAPPGAFYVTPENCLYYAAHGVLLDLRPLISQVNFPLNDFFPAALKEFEYKGGLYGLCRGFGNQDIFYNLGILKKAGAPRPPTKWTGKHWRFSDYLALAQRCTRVGGKGPTQWGCYVDTAYRGWFPWVWNNGGHILNAARTRSVMSTPATVGALQFLQDLIYRHKVAPTPADLSSQTAVDQFASGRMALLEGIPAGIANLRQSISGFAWDVAPMPAGPGGQYTSGGGIAYAIPKAFAHRAEAWAVVQALESHTAMSTLALTGTVFSPRKSVAMSKAYARSGAYPAHMNIFTSAADHVRIDPMTVHSPQIINIWTQQMGSLWDGSQSAKAVCAAIDQQVNALLGG